MNTSTVITGKNQEFFIEHDLLLIHAKLEFPESYAGGPLPLVIVQHGVTGHMEEDHILGIVKTFNDCGFATLRTELYGHGKSGGEFQDHTLFKWMSQMLTVIDYARGLDFVTDLFLCGHSQGGLIAILAGAMKRDVLRAILPLSPAVMIPEEARKGVFLGHTFDPEHIPDRLVMDEENVLNGNYLRVAQMVYAEPAIDAYDKDVLIIHGDKDESVPLEAGVKAAKRYKNAKLVIIPGDDHCYNNHLDQVQEALADFMRKYLS